MSQQEVLILATSTYATVVGHYQDGSERLLLRQTDGRSQTVFADEVRYVAPPAREAVSV